MTSRRTHSVILWNAPGGFLQKIAQQGYPQSSEGSKI